jgi:hypothetical protein
VVALAIASGRNGRATVAIQTKILLTKVDSIRLSTASADTSSVSNAHGEDVVGM